MARIEGHIIDGVAHGDRWLRSLPEHDQYEIYRSFLVALSRIHRADPARAGDVPRRDNAAELDFWEEYLDWSSDGSPVKTLVDGVRWCRLHRPGSDPPATLLWGDARFENVVFGDDLQPRAVLDWDMTSIGAAEHDLAWFTSLDSTMVRLFGKRTPGFPSREETACRPPGPGLRVVRDLGDDPQRGDHDPDRLPPSGRRCAPDVADRRQSHSRPGPGKDRHCLSPGPDDDGRAAHPISETGMVLAPLTSVDAV
jgi:hypothetical protein